MFLMNYLFDFADLTGAFSGDRTDPPGGGPNRGPLFGSKNWLKLIPSLAVPEPTSVTLPAFNPQVATFTDLLDMDSGTIVITSTPGGPDEGNVGIRIGLDPDSAATAGMSPPAASPVLTLSVCFGRPVGVGQRRSSPFFSNPGAARPNQIVQTTFVNTFANATGAGTASGLDALGHPFWFFPIGLIRHKPDPIPPAGSRQHRTHRYEYSVGITVASGGVIHHYSHDPEMDVGP
jgi:hypothetical protein